MNIGESVPPSIHVPISVPPTRRQADSSTALEDGGTRNTPFVRTETSPNAGIAGSDGATPPADRTMRESWAFRRPSPPFLEPPWTTAATTAQTTRNLAGADLGRVLGKKAETGPVFRARNAKRNPAHRAESMTPKATACPWKLQFIPSSCQKHDWVVVESDDYGLVRFVRASDR